MAVIEWYKHNTSSVQFICNPGHNACYKALGGKIPAQEKMLFCQHGKWDVRDYNHYHWGHVKTILADLFC